MRKRIAGILTVVALTFAGQQARGEELKARCDADMQNRPEMAGRNAWARKCGYIDTATEATLNTIGMYTTFVGAVAPTNEVAGCQPLRFLGACVVYGCYADNQRVMFEGTYHPIADAALKRKPKTVTSLSPSWNLGDETVRYAEQPIESYTVGDNFDSLVRVGTENGFVVDVTSNHPFVDEYGQVIRADQIKPKETRLMTEQGPSVVTTYRDITYRGQVWNVEPKSLEKRANILFAEGFLMGSVRYQNEWAEDMSRRLLRDFIPIAGF